MTGAGQAPRPEVSCVVAAYNDAALADRCLRSILGQSLTSVELIVADDSTSGDVRALVAALRAGGAKIDYLEGPRTGNPADNWNLGLDRARGRHSVLVHHDERFVDRGWLERASTTLRARPGRAIVAGHSSPGVDGASRFRAVSRAARLLRAPPWTLYAANWIGPTAAVMFPTSVGPRFDPRLRWLVDVDFYVRLWALTGPFLMEPASSVASTPHAGQITAGLDVPATHRRELALLSKRAGGRLGPGQVAAIALTLRIRDGLPPRRR